MRARSHIHQIENICARPTRVAHVLNFNLICSGRAPTGRGRRPGRRAPEVAGAHKLAPMAEQLVGGAPASGANPSATGRRSPGRRPPAPGPPSRPGVRGPSGRAGGWGGPTPTRASRRPLKCAPLERRSRSPTQSSRATAIKCIRIKSSADNWRLMAASSGPQYE